MGCPSISDREYRLIENITSTLYSSEKYFSVNQIISDSSLSDYTPAEILHKLKHMSEQFLVEIKSENESTDMDSEVYKIGHDGKISVDMVIDDYIENGDQIFEDDEDIEDKLKELEEISKITNKYERASRFFQTFTGNDYSGF